MEEKRKKKKLYISLPITGRVLKAVQEQAAYIKQIWSDKYDVITPFDINPDQDKPYSYYMGRDIEVLLECDAIFMAPGWVTSKGCCAEFQIATIYGIKIIGC